MPVKHVYSQTVGDGTATSVVRPSDWNSIHHMTLSLMGNTSGAGSTISGTDIVFQGGDNITLSATGSTVIWSAAGQTDTTYKYFNPQDGFMLAAGQQGQGTLHLQPTQAPNVQFDRICLFVNYSQATNSTLTASLSMWFGIYTRTDSTLSLLSSISTLYTVNGSGTVNSSLFNGQRILTIGSTNTLLNGQYWMGILSRTSTAGANASISQLVCSQINTNFSGVFGEATATTAQQTRGLGHYSATLSSLPNSIAFTQIRGTASMALRQPAFYLLSQTF